MSDGAVFEGLVSATELSVGGEGAFRTGLVASTPELSVGAKERFKRGRLHLWGVAGAPSVDSSPKGDAPLSPELTFEADEDAVDWYAPRSVTYNRRGE